MTRIETSKVDTLVRWFALLAAIGPVHMVEQILFGLDTLYELRTLLGGYYAMFSNPDLGTVLLVIMVVVFVQLLVLAAMAGGRWRLSVAGFFGLMGLMEAHHIVQSIASLSYFPGLITSFGYVWAGIMILRCVRRDWGASDRGRLERPAVAAQGQV